MINPQTALKPDVSGPLSRSVWFDLPANNLADAMSFYEGLLGWTYQQMDDSAIVDYVMINAGGKLIGGIRKLSKPASLNAPLSKGEEFRRPVIYFTVDQLAPKVARAKELGAEIIGPTVDLGKDRGRYQWIRDREGNLIGLWAPL